MLEYPLVYNSVPESCSRSPAGIYVHHTLHFPQSPRVKVILIPSGSLFVDLSRRFYTTKLSCKKFIPSDVQLKKPAAVLLKLWCWFSDSFIRCVEVK